MSLKELRERLLAEVGDQGRFAFINTRLILQTGVSLNLDEEPTPEQLELLRSTLMNMGFKLEGGTR